ncbi:MAG: ferrous iron transport protein A [Candidatus Omnitrophica bacterium]|nr:ferrous iron transport protein A [Candidatus Omnitrophota bacterium]
MKLDGEQVDFMPKGEEYARDIICRLSSLGVYPGAVINVRQHQPTAILRTGETDIALELALVERIYCRLLT